MDAVHQQQRRPPPDCVTARFEDAAPVRPRTARTEPFPGQPHLTLLIYIDARRGHTIQDLALRHDTPHRLALDTMQPPPRGFSRSHSHLDGDPMEPIQAMPDQDLGPKPIRLNLMDNHEVSMYHVRYQYG